MCVEKAIIWVEEKQQKFVKGHLFFLGNPNLVDYH